MTATKHEIDAQRARRLEHGRTAAAWTTVSILIVGWTVGGVAFMMASPWGVAIGVFIMICGLIIGKLMAMAGMGAMPGWQEQMPEGETPFEGSD